MKTNLYIIDGISRLILTPETDFDRECLAVLGSGERLCNLTPGDGLSIEIPPSDEEWAETG